MPAVIRTHDYAPVEQVDQREGWVQSEYVDDYSEDSSVIDTIGRVLALGAAAVFTIVGLIALARIDWDAGFDAAAVGVANMNFTPEVAVAVVVLGILAMGCAAARDGDVRLAMGAILAAAGVAILLLNSPGNDLLLQDRHGWLAFGTGAALALSGLLSAGGFVSRRMVQQRRRVVDREIDLRDPQY
jgi:hypothetical protein